MKNSKIKVFTLLIAISLQTPTFGVDECSNCQIIKAVNDLQTNTLNALQGDNYNSIVNMLNTIFIKEKKNFESYAPSILDKKVDLYAQKFYELYTTNFVNKISDVKKYQSTATQGLEHLLTQELGYYLQANTETNNKTKDQHALLTQMVEPGDNNIPPSTFLAGDLPKYFGIGNPYSSLSTQKMQLPSDSAALNVNSLLGPDGYTKEEEKKAKLFINYIYQSLELPNTVQIPTKTTKNGIQTPATDKEGNVNIYIPSTYKTPSGLKLPYTIAKVSINKPVTTEVDGKTEITTEYAAMLKKLRSNPNYQMQKMKGRIMLALRSIYHEIILNFYQDRLRNNDNKAESSTSLAEKENKMATEGLEPKYYDSLKNKTVADVNLETLYTLNKMVYFLHKLHKDNERTQLVLTTTAMSMQPSNSQDKVMAKIKDFFTKKCWDNSTENSNNQKACLAAQSEVDEEMPPMPDLSSQ